MDAMTLTLAEIAEQHYLPEKRRRRRANTVEGYESALRCHVLPRFGHRSVADIEHGDIQEWVDSFDRPGAAEKAYKTLRQVIRWAVRKWAMLVIDPTVGIELPRKPAYRFDTLSAKHLIKRLRGMWGHRLEPTCILSSALGLRPGESYALEWGDIDWRSGKVVVDKTLQQVRGGVRLYPTKTPKGDRELYLPKWALDRLRMLHRDAGKPSGRIIGDLTPSQVAGRIKRFAKRAKLPEITMQNTRHTWGTLAAEAGVPIETIAMQLGHSSIDVAYEHYMRRTKTIMQGAQRMFTKHLFKFA